MASGEWPGGCDAGGTGVLTPLINSSGAAALHYGLFIVTIIRPPAPRTPNPPPRALCRGTVAAAPSLKASLKYAFPKAYYCVKFLVHITSWYIHFIVL